MPGIVLTAILAMRWFLLAAHQGQSDGQYLLGWMLTHALGVERNDAEALVWIRKSAEQGNHWGQLNLAWMYLEGRGVAKNKAAAVVWYRKSAAQGNPRAAEMPARLGER